MAYTEYAFHINNDACSRIADNGGWVCVADFHGLHDDDLRHAIDMLDAPDSDSSCADIISKLVSDSKGVFIATASTPCEAMRLLCEQLDAR